MDLLQFAVLLDYLLEAADLHVVREEIGIEYVRSVMGAEIDHEITFKFFAQSLNACGYGLVKQLGNQDYSPPSKSLSSEISERWLWIVLLDEFLRMRLMRDDVL